MDTVDELADHVTSLRRYALMLCRDPHDAEDLVQEALVRAIAAADSFQRGGALRPWLFAILHNAFISSRRHYARRARAAAFLEVEWGQSTTGAQQEQSVEVDQTVRALSHLPLEQREPLTLIALEGMTYEEAAGVLGIPIGTMMSRLARGRAALRELMAGAAVARLKIVR